MSTIQQTCARSPTVERQPAILRVGRRDVIVRLLDQSAGSFSVSCEEPLRLALGQVLSLRSGMGWSEVEVVTVDRRDGKLRVDMRRLCDHPDPHLVQAVERNRRPPQFQQSVENRPHAVLERLLAGILLVAPAFWLIIGASSWPPLLEAEWRNLLRQKTVRQVPGADPDPRSSPMLFPREPAAR